MYFVPIMKKVQTGLVIEFYSNSCLVQTKNGQFNCLAIKNVVVGDIVSLEIIQDSKQLLGKIIQIRKRATKLTRYDGNKEKLLAANITDVGIIIAPKPKTSTEFIDKWILKSKISNISYFIVNNKIDMGSDAQYEDQLKIYKEIGIKIIDISAKHSINIERVTDHIKNKCTLFVGNSGSGKSTLTSKITGKNLKTNELSNEQGVHTTSISSLYKLKDNIKIIDSPGMRDIDISNYSKEIIINGFDEIQNSAKKCKYTNCNHINNDGCNILKSIINGEINKSRYNNFIKLRDDV